MIFIKSFEDFLLNEAVKNRKESIFILRNILSDIQKKYTNQVDGGISFGRLELRFDSIEIYKLFVNDKNFIKSLKQKYDTSDKTIIYDNRYDNQYEISIKDLFFDRVVVPKYLYHVTTKDKVDYIKKLGLIPSINSTYGNCSYDKPFVFASIDKNRLFINDDNAVVLIINTEGLNNKWHKDFNFPYDNVNHICTQQPIPKSAIKIISYKMFDKNRNKY